MDEIVAAWQADTARLVAESIRRGNKPSMTSARMHGKRAFLDLVDADMEENGWTVLAPGVYRAPSG